MCDRLLRISESLDTRSCSEISPYSILHHLGMTCGTMVYSERKDQRALVEKGTTMWLNEITVLHYLSPSSPSAKMNYYCRITIDKTSSVSFVLINFFWSPAVFHGYWHFALCELLFESYLPNFYQKWPHLTVAVDFRLMIAVHNSEN